MVGSSRRNWRAPGPLLENRQVLSYRVFYASMEADMRMTQLGGLCGTAWLR